MTTAAMMQSIHLLKIRSENRRTQWGTRHTGGYRPRLCKNAKRNLPSKHRPSKTRCIRLFLVGYWSEDPRIRNSIEFLHSLDPKQTVNSARQPRTQAFPQRCLVDDLCHSQIGQRVTGEIEHRALRRRTAPLEGAARQIGEIRGDLPPHSNSISGGLDATHPPDAK